MKTRLRFGMVGGGQGAFIGDVHRKAAVFDGICRLTAGCFSRDYENTRQTGEMLDLDPDRCYRTYEEMAEREASREDGIDFVSVVTPNKSHYAIAKAFLNRGIHVICDKPLTVELREAEELARIAKERGLLFAVTYTKSGYPLVKHAREMVRNGELGEIHMVMAEYAQDWLINHVNSLGSKQVWRTDPSEGKSASVADIGSHIEHTVSYITGLQIDSLCARLDAVGPGMELDTNASIMLRYDNGATGLYWASQVAHGNKNGLRIRVYGSKGGLEWEQEYPDEMRIHVMGQTMRTVFRGRDPLYPLAESCVRIPGGHPEGTYEAFANIYRNFANAVLKQANGEKADAAESDYPDVTEGVQGVKFIDKCLESQQAGSAWVRF